MIVVSGGAVSTTQVLTVGALVPVTPDAGASPSATTAKVCVPCGSGPGTTTGDVHGVRSAPSSEHQYRVAPVAEKPRVAEVAGVAGGGPWENETAGGCVDCNSARRAASWAWTLPGGGLTTAAL